MTQEIQAGEQPSLRKRALFGASATVIGFGTSQLLRLGSNVVLSRLLFPEAFGLMAIVNLFMQGLAMFSDIGITPAVIQHKDGGEESFLNTAWTIQIVRGSVLWICLCLLAYPVSVFYSHGEFIWMLPVVGLNAFVLGFRSTAVASLNRKLILGRQTFVDLVSQATSVAVMVALALTWRSVWSLVVGGLVGSVVSVALSHLALPGIRHRFRWDSGARRELVKFGRWITVSTAFTFLASQGDRAIVSTFVTIGMVGVYSVAANLSQSMQNVFSRLSSAVLFPVYASWGRESPEKLSQKLRGVRTRALWLFLLAPCAMAVLGDPLIRFLYDARYHDAGWMLPLMSIALVFHVLVITVDPVLLATGDSYRHMILTITKGAVVFVSMVVGGYLRGLEGVLLGSVVGRALQYPLLVAAVRAKGAWMPWLDLAAVSASALVIFGGRALLQGLR